MAGDGGKVRALLAQAEPHANRYIASPLPDGEIAELEERAGALAPDCIRDFLAVLGFRQDLLPTDRKLGQWMESAGQVIDAATFIAENLEEDPALFPIAHDGAGDYTCVRRVEGSYDSPVLFYDHETEEVTELAPSFVDWLEQRMAKLAKGLKRRPLNSRKRWYFQIVVRIDDAAAIAAALGRRLQVELPPGDWSKETVLPSGVVKSERPLVIEGQIYELRRSTDESWEEPMVAFDLDEPPGLSDEDSLIRRACGALDDAGVPYRKVDYGVLRAP